MRAHVDCGDAKQIRRRAAESAGTAWAARTFRAATWAIVAWALLACGESSPEQRRDDAQALLGRELLARYHCGTCHSIPGVAGARGHLAVSLQAYGRRSYIAGRVANEPAALAQWIADPASIVPGTLMPNLGVAPDDARAMALYLSRQR